MGDPPRDSHDAVALLSCPVDDEPPSTAVVRAVATASNTEATRLPPLYDTVDPDTLDRLFPPEATGGELWFDYAGFAVVVGSNGTVELHETADSPLST